MYKKKKWRNKARDRETARIRMKRYNERMRAKYRARWLEVQELLQAGSDSDSSSASGSPPVVASDEEWPPVLPDDDIDMDVDEAGEGDDDLVLPDGDPEATATVCIVENVCRVKTQNPYAIHTLFMCTSFFR